MKFGGTSVGSADSFAQVAKIVLEQAEQWNCLMVFVSVMSGVTDALIKSAQLASQQDDQDYHAVVADLRSRHHLVVDKLMLPDDKHAQLLTDVDKIIDKLAAFCYGIHILGEVTPNPR